MSKHRPLWWNWPTWKLRALHRVAKRSGFFNDPRLMKQLRDCLTARPD